CWFLLQAVDGIRDFHVTGVQTCALPILRIEVHTLPPRQWDSVPHVVTPDDPSREHGRGLYLVDQWSHRWGTLGPWTEGVYSVVRWDGDPCLAEDQAGNR